MNMTFRRLVALLAVVLLPLAAQAEETTTYYVNDLLGSPVAAMDAQGNVLWTETYAPYGARIEESPANSGSPAYAGKPEDPVTGLVYMGARWYDPETGRFASVDPVRFVDSNVHSFNRYAYANNSPYVFVDPDGRNAEALFTELTPAVGRLYAANVAFAVGLATGDPYLMDAATDGMRENAGEAAWAVTDTVNPLVGAGKIRRSVGMTEKVANTAGRTVAETLPQGITRVKNAKGEVFKEVHTPPSKPHAGMEQHTHPNYRNVLPDGSVRTGVSKDAIPVSRKDIIDATRPGAQRTGGN